MGTPPRLVLVIAFDGLLLEVAPVGLLLKEPPAVLLLVVLEVAPDECWPLLSCHAQSARVHLTHPWRHCIALS